MPSKHQKNFQSALSIKFTNSFKDNLRMKKHEQYADRKISSLRDLNFTVRPCPKHTFQNNKNK